MKKGEEVMKLGGLELVTEVLIMFGIITIVCTLVFCWYVCVCPVKSRDHLYGPTATTFRIVNVVTAQSQPDPGFGLAPPTASAADRPRRIPRNTSINRIAMHEHA